MVRGDSEMLSMAAYGEPSLYVPGASTSYERRPLPVLLCLYHRHWTSLNLAISLMFCLKLFNDNVGSLAFPYLYLDLYKEDIDIERLSRPVA